MQEIKRIEPGSRMSEATIYGGKVYSAGVVADKAAGKSVYEQTKDVLGQIDELLAKAGSDKTKILKANIWLTNLATFSEMNKAWDEWVVPGKTPARATVEAKLADPSWAIEIMIEAAV